MNAPLPTNEEARLATLGRLAILDTLPEQAFDDLVEAAGALMDVPIAFLSMMDRDRQWFKSRMGIQLCSTTREVAFCSHAILNPEPLVVPDTMLDDRFFDNPLVMEVGIRFYAGAPILVDGHPVGTICCADTVPRTPTPRQVAGLAALARQAVALLEARLRAESLAESERRFSAFLDHAPSVAFLKDDQGRMRYVNSRFETMFGRPAESVLGLTDYEWLPKEFADGCARDDDQVSRTGAALSFYEEVPVSGGETRLWHTHKFPFEVDGKVWIGGIVADETALRAAETKVRLQNAELLRREEALAAALRDAEAMASTAKFAANRFEQLFTNLPVACYTFDAEGTIQEWNDAAEALWGIPSHVAFLRSVRHTAACAESPQEDMATMRRVLSGERIRDEERSVTRPNGETRWVIANTFPIRDALGQIVGGLSAQIDVTDRRRAEGLMRDKEERFRTAVDALQEGLVVQDEAGKVVLWNPSAERVLGLSGSELAGLTPLDPRWGAVREDGSALPGDEHPIVRAMRTGDAQDTMVMGVKRSDGALRWLRINAAPVMSDDGRATLAMASFLDITEEIDKDRQINEQMMRLSDYSCVLEIQAHELEAANHRLEGLATTDGLTGLKNHRYFQDFLRKSLGDDRPLSIALLDVDRFKSYNDDFGHQAGDDVLRGVAAALQSAVREGDLVARYGGEEFVLVLPGARAEEASQIAERARQAVSVAQFPNRAVTASFGVVTRCSFRNDAESLIRAADEALYESKSSGRNRVTFAEEAPMLKVAS